VIPFSTGLHGLHVDDPVADHLAGAG
jgi:hypothetical protein